MIGVRADGLVHMGGGVIGAKWWWVGWSLGVVRWLGARGGGDLQIVLSILFEYLGPLHFPALLILFEDLGPLHSYRLGLVCRWG